MVGGGARRVEGVKGVVMWGRRRREEEEEEEEEGRTWKERVSFITYVHHITNHNTHNRMRHTLLFSLSP